MQKLSIIIPAYNEQETIEKILEKVVAQRLKNWQKEIIVVNDGSTDKSKKEVEKVQAKYPEKDIQLINLAKNHGKGYSLRQGFKRSTGDVILVQDADLEYDPQDYPDLLKPIEEDKADVVYGSRFTGKKPHRSLYFWHYQANRFLTTLSNLLTDLNLSDIETGYKVFTRDVLEKLNLKEDGFGFEPEFTAKVAKLDSVRVYEIGISYHGRTYQEGKKITWQDGLHTLWCILRYNIVK